MTPALFGIGVALAALIVGWLIAAGVRLVRRRIWQRGERRRLAKMWQGDNKHQERTNAGENQEAAVVVREVQRTLIEAKREASEIIGEAEQKAGEIVAAAELAGAQLEREAAHERKLADEKRGELSNLLLSLLAEVQRTSGAAATTVHSLNEARETRSGKAAAAE